MNACWRASLVVLADAFLALGCIAQCAAPQWFAANGYPGLQGGYAISSTVWDPDGAGPAAPALVVGGNFTIAGTEVVSGVAYWDGAGWHGIGSGQLTGDIKALAVFNGALVASNDTFSGSGIVRWNGTSWQPMATNLSIINAFAVYNGELYAGGGFAGQSLVRWDGAAWQPVPGNGFSSVRALAVYNGELVVGGTSAASGHIATWNGMTWGTLGTGMNAQVTVLAVHNGGLVAGGDFVMAGGVPANRVARWSASSWQALGSGLGGSPTSLAVWNGNLAAATSQTLVWDGSAWQVLGTATGAAPTIGALAAFGGDLFALGQFDGIGGIVAERIARWNGQSWLRVGAGFNFEILTLAPHGGDLIAGGTFTVAGTVEAAGVARFDGTSWHPLGSGVVGYGGFSAVGAFASFNGDLIMGGSFIMAGGVYAPNVARWDGTSWQAMGAGLDGSGGPLSWDLPGRVVRALAVYNGELIAGGYITNANFAPINFVARWNGISWQPLGTGTNGPVHALCVYNGELFAGGLFTSAGGVPVLNVARWNGTAWHAAGTGPTAVVEALVPYGPDLVAGGIFTGVNGGLSQGVARWNGTAWSTIGLPGNNGVRALATYGGDLVATSSQWALPTTMTPGIARWTGTTWAPLGSGITLLPNVTFGVGVRTLAVYRGSLFAAGQVAAAGSVASPMLVRWAPPLPLLSVTQPGGSGSVRISDEWLVPNHEYYNLASLDLCAAGVGSGPYGGLCANDPSTLYQQLILPVGTAPFHFVAAGTTTAFGQITLPPGLSFDALTVDVTGFTLGCISTPIRYTVY